MENLNNLTSYEVANMILCNSLDTSQSDALISEYANQMKTGGEQVMSMETATFEGLIEARNNS